MTSIHEISTTRIVVIIFATFIATLSLSHFAGPRTTCQSVSITQTVPDPPTLRPITRTFQALPKIEDLSYDADEDWQTTLSTPKGGFLWMQYNETMNEAWGVSMFHAIHCLSLIRNMVQASSNVSGFHDSSKDSHSGHIPLGHPQLDTTHVGHCFAYISQHIMCAADETIEPPWETLDENGYLLDGGVDGEGYAHQCRDSRFLWETVMRSEEQPITHWGWKDGDTVSSVFRPREAAWRAEGSL